MFVCAVQHILTPKSNRRKHKETLTHPTTCSITQLGLSHSLHSTKRRCLYKWWVTRATDQAAVSITLFLLYPWLYFETMGNLFQELRERAKDTASLSDGRSVYTCSEWPHSSLLSQTGERLDVMYKWDNSMHFQTVSPWRHLQCCTRSNTDRICCVQNDKKAWEKSWIPAYVFTSEHLDNRSSGHDGCFQKCRRKDSVVRMLGWEGVSDTVWWSDKHFVWSKQMHSVSVLVRVWIKLFPIPGYTANDLSFHPATLLPLRYTPVWSICCPHAHTLELEAWLCINMAKNVVFS